MLGTLVVKLGGEVVRGESMRDLAVDLAAIASTRPLVVVHGGGAQATELGARLGVAARKVQGLRVTDDETLEVVKLALSAVNVDLCAALVAAGSKPIGLTGASALAIRATKRAPLLLQDEAGEGTSVDLGHVGDVASINAELLRTLTKSGFVPVLACLGADAEGNLYNINADTVAASVALAMNAEALVLVSDVPGVLRDPTDNSTRVPRLSKSRAQAEIAAGTITRGMAVKLEEAFAALDAGVARIHVTGCLAPGDLVEEMRDPGSRGTLLEIGEP